MLGGLPGWGKRVIQRDGWRPGVDGREPELGPLPAVLGPGGRGVLRPLEPVVPQAFFLLCAHYCPDISPVAYSTFLAPNLKDGRGRK